MCGKVKIEEQLIKNIEIKGGNGYESRLYLDEW